MRAIHRDMTVKILRPDLPAQLQAIADVTKLLRADDALSGFVVENADIAGLKVKSAVITESKLTKCTLAQSKIEKLQIRDCIFENCDLTASIFADSSWHVAEVINSRCSGLQLHSSLLKNILFKGCKLDFANFRYSRLENVIFEDCVITDMDFYHATLKNVTFVGCDIENVEFSGSNLAHVDLTASRIVSLRGLHGLKGAWISAEQLMQLAPALAQEIGVIIKD